MAWRGAMPTSSRHLVYLSVCPIVYVLFWTFLWPVQMLQGHGGDLLYPPRDAVVYSVSLVMALRRLCIWHSAVLIRSNVHTTVPGGR